MDNKSLEEKLLNVMKCIDIEQVIIFHSKVISKTGRSTSIRDISIIESSLNRTFASFDRKGY